MIKKIFLISVVLAILLAACAPRDNRPDSMEASPTDAVMEEKALENGSGVPDTGSGAMMDKTPTVEMMEDKPGDAGAMMEKTATLEMMGEKTEEAGAMMEKTGTAGMIESTQDPMMGTETPQTGMMEEKESMMPPAWFSAELMDEGTGEMFMIEDFKGKVVLVETFAQWCPTCLRQQMEIEKLQAMMGMPDDLVTISLDVDPNEDAEMLKKYLEKHGFDWRFAIASPETAREIGNLYGQQFLNPPSAPVFVIDRKGNVHPLPFGVKSAEDLQEALKPFLEEGM